MRAVTCALLMIAISPFAHAQWYANEPARDGVTTTGEAEVRVAPDQVEIALGVETRDASLERARAKNDAATAAIIAAAKRDGVDAARIKTDFVNIEPEYRWDASVAGANMVRKSLVITLSDISQFERLLSDVVAAGANHVHRVRFSTSELRKHRDEARVLAAKAAREKAQLLAQTLGGTLGSVRSISEPAGDDWWSSYGSWWGWGSSQSQNVVQNAGGPSASDLTSIAPGQISVRARVTATFDLVK